MKKTAIILEIEQHLGFQLTHIHDIEAVMQKKYPPSYLEVMGVEFEMVGAVYSKTAFTDADGNLVGLNLFDAAVTDAQLDFLLNEKTPMALPHLLSLNLAKNPITHFEFLPGFSSLVFAEFHECSKLEMVQILGDFKDLVRLELQDCNLKMAQIPASCQSLYYLDLSGNKELTGCKLDASLASLQVLFIRGTSLEAFELPDTFPELVHLYLNSNKLKRLTLRGELPALSTLQLRKNSFTDFSEQTIQLGHEQVENKDFFKAFQNICPALDSVFLGENDLVSEELAGKIAKNEGGNHLDILRKHFEQRATGIPQPNNECKVLLIGNGKAGKSNILNRLTDRAFNEKWDSTHGIHICHQEEKPYDLYYWDFGGQDIYHSTHRMFMQKNSVYVLAWRKETEENLFTDHEIPYKNGTIRRKYRNYKLSYWLSYAHFLGEGSPMNVVQTNIKQDKRIEVETDIRARFGQSFDHLEFHQVELKGNQNYADGIEALEGSITESVAGIKAQKQTIAEPLFKIREYLRSLKQPSLSYEEYEAKALALGVVDPLNELETWLFLSGVVYFKRGVFNDRLILDQQWAIKAIYMLFDREDLRTDDIRKNGGEFSGEFLSEIWASDYPDPQVQEELVGFMKDCDICYEVDSGKEHPSFSERVFVAPKLLPDFKPSTIDDFWIREEKVHKKSIIHLKYSYQFLHARVIESVIVKTAYLADRWEVWQSGLQISEGQNMEQVVEVESSSNTIRLRFTKAGIPLAAKVMDLIEELQDEKAEKFILNESGEYVALQAQEFVGKRGLQEVENFSNASLLGELHRSPSSGSAPEAKEKEFDPKGKQAPKSNQKEETIRLITQGLLKEAFLRLAQWRPDLKDTVISVWREEFLKIDTELFEGKISAKTAKMYGEGLKTKMIEFLAETNEQPATQRKSVSEPFASEIHAAMDGNKKVLFMAAVPKGLEQIDYDVEYKLIKGIMEHNSEYQLLPPELKLTPFDMMQAFFDPPEIVHFSGHGEQEGIILETQNGYSELLLEPAAQELFGLLKGKTKLIVLNACSSSDQARLVSEFGFLTIGLSNLVNDQAAIEFSRYFYTPFMKGKGIERSFKLAKALVNQQFPDDALLFEAWHNGTLLPW